MLDQWKERISTDNVRQRVAGTTRPTGSVVYPGVKVKNPVKEQLLRLRQQKQQVLFVFVFLHLCLPSDISLSVGHHLICLFVVHLFVFPLYFLFLLISQSGRCSKIGFPLGVCMCLSPLDLLH